MNRGLENRGGKLALALLAFAGCTRPTLSAPPEPAATREGRWEQDVVYVTDNVARLHPDAFRYASRADYERARDALLRSIPELDDAQIAVGLAAIVARLRDAHTAVALPLGSESFPLLPVHIEGSSEQLHVLALPRSHEAWLGAVLVGVGEVSLDDALTKLGEAVSHENEYGIWVEAPLLLRTPAVLHALGLTPRNDRVELVVEKDGQRHTLAIELADAGEELVAVEQSARPYTQQRQDENYWFESLADEGCVYFAYNSCYEDPERPFATFAREVLDALEEPHIERLIVDLRRNRGGSQLVAWPLLKKLDGHRLDRPGGIVVLIGARTFSSGRGNALDLREWTDAILMGTPTRQRPATFGEIETFLSPNHELHVSHSTKFFRRGPLEETAVRPDVEVRYTLDEVLQGIDSGFEAALAYEP